MYLNNPRICFVIPTYNERDNILDLLGQLVDLYKSSQILIVDDESPDNTSEIVNNFASNNPSVHLLSGRKRGLGEAYKRGIYFAITQLKADIIIQMDADFSHNPAVAEKLINLIHQGYDVAVGSRYIEGGEIDVNWPKSRRWLSKGGNQLARYIAGIRSVCDCTSGFRAIRAKKLQESNIQTLSAKGYSFQIQLIHRMINQDAKIKEYPIYFQDRSCGQTKLQLYDILEFFITVWVLRFKNIGTLLKFSMVGLSGIIVNLSFFYVLLELGIHKYIASIVAVEISIICNFLFNNYWTFSPIKAKGNLIRRGLRFNFISFISLIFSFSTFFLISSLSTWHLLACQTIAILPAFLFNYFSNLLWVFKPKESPQDSLKNNSQW